MNERSKKPFSAASIAHGISGAKGRDKRPGFDALCPRCNATGIRSGHGLVGRSAGPEPARPCGFPIRAARAADRPLPASAGIDTTTPASKAMFQMMGVFAEFERAMIQERSPPSTS
jgi:hypothetical protein